MGKHKSHKYRSRSRSRSRSREHKNKHSRRSRSSGRLHDKKHKRRRESPTASGSGNATISPTLRVLKLAEEQRLKQLEQRKRAREEMKAQETPEEKRARRLREKAEKEQRRRERMGWDAEYQQYSNEDNPFGDSNLTSTFCWAKKFEKEGLSDAPAKTIEAISMQKQLENKRELEKVKKSRAQRELERQAREEDAMLQQRAKEAAQFREWEDREHEFHLEQARMRSEIRIRDGRAKPIDLLAQYVTASSLEDAIEVQMYEPYELLKGLGTDELNDLLADIEVYMKLEHGANSDYWTDLITIVQDELKKELKRKQQEADDTLCRRDGIHSSVTKDVTEIFRNKSTEQLEQMQQRIEQKLSSRGEGVDLTYWDTVLSQLKAHMARSRLRDRHQKILREKLEALKQEQARDDDGNESAANEPAIATLDETSHVSGASEKTQTETEVEDKCEGSEFEGVRLYEVGNYSPAYLPESYAGIEIINEADDYEKLLDQRNQMVNRQAERETQGLSARERLMHMEARKGMLGDEVEFSVETPIEDVPQMASDKYRPRKPRYFNRVHTGFEWNKYNQTHYDMDNPPPKIVQGYKFNIFYPDLIDRSKTPKYSLKSCEDNPDFAILRFHTGPPYEDIAFKIVNREWEYSYKRGFRCQFHNNIFQLWFHFKRYRYRR